MSGIITPNFNYTYPGQLSNEILIEPALQHKPLKEFFTIIQGVTSDRQLPKVARLGRVLAANDGSCDRTVTGSAIQVTNATLSTAKLKMFLPFCPDDFWTTELEELLTPGVAENDLDTAKQELQRVIAELVIEGIRQDLTYLSYFGNTGSGTEFLTPFNGFWTEMLDASEYDVVTATSTIGDTLSDGEAITIFDEMWADSDPILKSLDKSRLKLTVTGSLYDNYAKSLRTLGVDLGFTQTQTGEGAGLQWNGIQVVPMWDWDVAIESFGLANPHRAALTTKENHYFGTSKPSSWEQFRSWYSIDDDKYYFDLKMNAGYTFIHPKLQTIAY